MRTTNFQTVLAWTFALALFLAPANVDAARKKQKDVAKAAAEKEGSEKDEAKWNVSEPPGDKRTVSLDTVETTWSNLDVSADGTTLVFDMLGDIYSVSIAGGDATALTNGIEWNIQPRYSPDGSKIAFISDRGGADNLWVMNADGSDPKAVSEEKTHLVHNPAWSPDGDFLVAKKGVMGSRSIAAGEIWMFHASGGGLRLIERSHGDESQKNIAEPVFSHDGRYVYFSQDTTPGARWEYGKNAVGQVFTIRRLDRRTGEIVTFVSGAGGAIRPTPSGDGRYLAFVKRTASVTSALYLKDLKSGREWSLYDRLDRDLQETDGSLGNTPAFAWTPDHGSLVFWAGGKIRRVDVESREVREIPVRVRTEKSVLPALRFAVDVAPDSFPVKMLRWARKSPTGEQAVFQALGHLWGRGVVAGEEPRRLTDQDDHFEFYPSFSRDGRYIVYTTWDDQDLGSIRVIHADGGSSRTVTTEPGIYVEPTDRPSIPET